MKTASFNPKTKKKKNAGTRITTSLSAQDLERALCGDGRARQEVGVGCGATMEAWTQPPPTPAVSLLVSLVALAMQPMKIVKAPLARAGEEREARLDAAAENRAK